MSQEQVASPAAGLFQKAHAKMVLIQRLDSQLASVVEQRSKAQEELESIQIHIHDEFDRFKKESDDASNRLLSDAPAKAAHNGNGNGNGNGSGNGNGNGNGNGMQKLVRKVDEVARETVESAAPYHP